MGIFYIIITFLLVVLFSTTLVKKVNIKGLDAIIISIVSYFCYTAIMSFILTLVGLKINLEIMLIANFIVIAFLLKVIKLDLRTIFSTFKLSKIEIVVLLATLSISIFIFHSLYTNSFNIAFETTDPSVHYIFSKYFADNGTLLFTENTLEAYKHMSDYPFLTYVNIGLIMNAFGPTITDLEIFIIWNIFIFFLITILSVLIIQRYVKDLKMFLSLIAVVIISFGYNLNGLIFGFSSQMIGVLIILSILYIIDIEKRQTQLLFVTLLINMIGLFYAYYYYIPAVFIGVIYYWSFITRKKGPLTKRVFNYQNIILTITLTLFGAIYLFYLVAERGSTGLAKEGYIYRDLFNSFTPFIFLTLYLFLNDRKNNMKINPLSIFFSAFFGFSTIVFILGMMGKASSYYYFKNYYILHILVLIIAMVALHRLILTNVFIYKSYIITLIFLIVMSFVGDGLVKGKNLLFSPGTNVFSDTVFNFNLSRISSQKPIILNKDENEIISYFLNKKEELKGNCECINVVGSTLEQLWFYSLTEIWPEDNKIELGMLYDPDIIDYKLWIEKTDKNPYMIVFYESGRKWMNDNSLDLNDFEVIYENESGVILKLKS